MRAVRDMKRNINVAVNSYRMIRQMFSDCYKGLQELPTPFLQNTVGRFENEITEYHKWIDEHEWLICMDTCGPSSSSSSLLQVLPNTMRNVFAFLLKVSHKIAELHETVLSLKKRFLLDLRRRGQESDPFLEADRRETTRQEVANRRVHPTIHLSTTMAQPCMVAGSLPSSQQQTFSTLVTPSALAPGSSGSPPSIFPPSNPTPLSPMSIQFGFSGFQPQAPVCISATSQAPLESQSSTQLSSISFSPQPMDLQQASTPQFGSTPNPTLFGAPPSTSAAGRSFSQGTSLAAGSGVGSPSIRLPPKKYKGHGKRR